MRRWKSSFLAVVMTVAALAQTASEKPGIDVLRVAHHLACQCGCSDTVATCSMLECHFSKPAKLRIAKLQGAGMSDQAIIDQFIGEYGQGIYRADPNAWGWVVPYASIGFGLVVIWLSIRRFRKPRPVPELGPAPDDPALAKYNEQIEKDLARLD
jgi:cytochrome c-type biogenesis protein CcmH/NrfF